MKVTLTRHASVDRLDRLVALVEYLGVGDIVLEVPDDRHEDTIRCLTSTGIIFVKSITTGAIITGYMAGMDQVHAMYYSANYSKVPSRMYTRVAKNLEKYKFLRKM